MNKERPYKEQLILNYVISIFQDSKKKKPKNTDDKTVKKWNKMVTKTPEI
jgi:hypothetical protein